MGGTPDRFWTLTPRMMAVEISAAAKRRKSERNDAIWLAWHTAALSRMDKLPKLQSLMSDTGGSKRKSPGWQTQLAEMSAWAAKAKKE